ncbi:Dam family site-specific DNA-(adenine-N6)-methyltransferase [Candidatus Saccharibacteria bacterium]|nr:Dam family site-specific DNA-(adenine-N6)-methyltransferase [Candidatus Saccharibacteria bacterium]
MDLISAKEAALQWDISQRRVLVLCSEGRIPGAQIVGNSWVIPRRSKKPNDARTIKARNKTNEAKPFLKWAGGKGQLLNEISKYYPFTKKKHIKKYAEPFVGGGAVLFDILNKYDVDEVYISDINAELINTYITIRDNPEELISLLKCMENEYLPLDTLKRKEAYISKRACFNELKRDGFKNVELAALMIFLNKTCFNGLYRVNRKGEYNVPMGAYKNPQICNANNLLLVSKKLQNANIVCGDYKDSASFIDDRTFVYLDPPYRPLTKTASFTSYTEHLFDDDKQLELANFVQLLDNKGAKIVVSNSDPKNTNEEDNFFENAYANQNIKRVSAMRMINRNSNKRGRISELLISNF